MSTKNNYKKWLKKIMKPKTSTVQKKKAHQEKLKAVMKDAKFKKIDKI